MKEKRIEIAGFSLKTEKLEVLVRGGTKEE